MLYAGTAVASARSLEAQGLGLEGTHLAHPDWWRVAGQAPRLVTIDSSGGYYCC